MRLHPFTPALLPFLLISCSPGNDQPAGNGANLSVPIGNNVLMPGNEAEVPPHAAIPANGTGEAPEENSELIPARIRGRWGLVPADCTSRHGDAKGLLEISKNTLGFYESRGTLKDFIEWSPARIRADFAFSGEGMDWQREMMLELRDGGEKLMRREYGADAMTGPLVYRRCPAPK